MGSSLHILQPTSKLQKNLWIFRVTIRVASDMANGRRLMAKVNWRNAVVKANLRNRGKNLMAKYEHFEDLPVWQESAKLYNAVLDLFETPELPLTSGFRNQLDRAAISVSNNVAEGFERSTTGELLTFIGFARGSAGEVRSMIAVVKERPKLKRIATQLERIRSLADSCARQLTGWEKSIERLPFDGRRHLSERDRQGREAAQKAREFRLTFLRNLKPLHPLYNSTEARAARGEQGE
jgi:four helix bundle protein